MIFVINLRLYEGWRSPVLIWLCLWFFSICFGEISQNFHNYLQRLSCRTFKSLNKGVTKAVSSLFAILCFLRLSQIWPDEYFLPTGTRKGTKMFNGPANLRKFHRRKRNKSCSKDSYFLCHKTLRYGMELRQDLYLSMRKLGNLSLGVFFSVDLFFRRRRPINKT